MKSNIAVRVGASFAVRLCRCTVILAALAAAAAMTACGGDERVKIVGLRCEYADEPLAIDGDSVRFTWRYESDEPVASFRQHKVEVRVAKDEASLADDETCVVTSGRVRGGQLVALPTDSLEAESRYCWQVRGYNALGVETMVSPVAWFSTAKLHGAEWSAKWITDAFDKDYEPAPMFRKRFRLSGEVARASLYISAAGYYDAAINGSRVSDDWLNPGYTHYDRRNLYMVHDVTDLLHDGDNVITATLGNGFYNEYSGMAVWQFESARWRNRPRMICELLVEYADGRTQKVLSNSTWRTATGPVRGNVIYAGDIIDARCEVEGWNDPAMDDSAYPAAVVCEAPSPLLVAQQMPPIRESETCEPVSVRRLSDTVYVFSFARNMTGVCTLRVRGEAGTRITMEHGELLRTTVRSRCTTSTSIRILYVIIRCSATYSTCAGTAGWRASRPVSTITVSNTSR